MITSPVVPVSAALGTHLETQFAFYTNLCDKFFDAVQKLSTLNIQVAKTMLEESVQGTQRAASLKTPADLIGHLASQSKPSFDKVYAYQQHIQRILVETRSDVSQTVETFAPESVRATQALVSETVQVVAQETDKAAQRQKEIASDVTASIIDSLVTKSGPTAAV